MTTIFFVSLLICVYTYLGYGIVVWLLVKIKENWVKPKAYPSVEQTSEWPAVTLLVAAYNEADILGDKLQNCFDLDYPQEQLQLLFVTDGSNDRSAEILASADGILHLHDAARRGKIAAVKRAMKYVKTDYVVFTDANTFLNPLSIKRLVHHFQDPSIGAVAGEKRVRQEGDKAASGAGEGLYWKYESFLKNLDTRFYSVVGAAGELYAIRTALFQPVPADAILDDFEQTLKIAQAGYRVAYEPDAFAEEEPSADLHEELKRKVRICAGGFQAMSRLLPLLNIFQFGRLSFQYISHRVLRWTIAPLCLPIALFSNVYLAYFTESWLFKVLLLLQIGFYLQAFLGYTMQDRKVSIKGFFVPLYFCIMNYAVYAGFLRFIRKKQSVNWEKAKRASQVQ
ncbi:MAG: glycosyltransferase family 2 protein [Saprospiraceae bacterium]|nr:glycosyltransferase family 2 protein [Saprospiraceae bacterium]